LGEAIERRHTLAQTLHEATTHHRALEAPPCGAPPSVTLTSNGNPVAGPAGMARMAEPPARASRGQLRKHFQENGYLLLRDVLDLEQVLALRRDYIARLDAAPQPLPPYGTAGHPAYDLVRSAGFDRLTRDPRLARIARVLLERPVELVPRRIVRHYDPATSQASRAHIDFDYMDRGAREIVTMWLPLGDCPIITGGLVYLEGSHRIPRGHLDQLRAFTDRPADRRPISNDLARTAATLGGRWLYTDFRAGDVVVHSPDIVHASLDNSSPVMRLSADVRFRRTDATPDDRWNDDWSADDGY
jgi:hypothetical protein